MSLRFFPFYYKLKCRRVAPEYAADLSVPILDRGRNAKERKIGSSTMCRSSYYKLLYKLKKGQRKNGKIMNPDKIMIRFLAASDYSSKYNIINT